MKKQNLKEMALLNVLNMARHQTGLLAFPEAYIHLNMKYTQDHKIYA